MEKPTHGNKYIVEIAQIENVIVAYNNVVSVHLNTRNTHEAKKLRKLLIAFKEMVRNIANNLYAIICRIKITKPRAYNEFYSVSFRVDKQFTFVILAKS